MEKPRYGLVTNIDTHNPLRIATHEWAAIGQDVWRAPDWRSRFSYVFGPPGWSHDGSRKTSEQLREEAGIKEYREERNKGGAAAGAKEG